MSTEQRETLEAVLRQSAFPVDSDVNEHPYPAAVDDALAAYEALVQAGTAPADIAFAGESADVEVTLDITPRVPHVFQAYHPILDEAAAALDRAGELVSAHLAGAERLRARGGA